MVTGWLWGGYGVATEWLLGSQFGYGMVTGWLEHGYGAVMGWLGDGCGVVTRC